MVAVALRFPLLQTIVENAPNPDPPDCVKNRKGNACVNVRCLPLEVAKHTRLPGSNIPDKI